MSPITSPSAAWILVSDCGFDPFEAPVELFEALVELADLLRRRSLGVVHFCLIRIARDERARDRRGDDGQEADPEEHDERGEESAGGRRRNVVAVPDGGGRLDGPPEG